MPALFNVRVILALPEEVTVRPELPEIAPVTLIVRPAVLAALKTASARLALREPARTTPVLSERKAPISTPPCPAALLTIMALLMVTAPLK